MAPYSDCQKTLESDNHHSFMLLIHSVNARPQQKEVMYTSTVLFLSVNP